MHHLYVATNCNYTLAGLAMLLRENIAPVRVIKINRPEDILLCPPDGGNRAVLVLLPPGEPATRAFARIFLWRWTLTLPVSRVLKQTPCLLLCDKNEGGIAGTCPVIWQSSLPELRARLSAVLASPHLYVRSSSRARPLTETQAAVLEATLAGETVQATASRLGVNTRAVFACRAAMVHKMGLRNRLELMCLGRKGIL